MPDRRAKVVIVGGGFGGIEAAKSLRRAPVEVTVIDRQNHHCFQPLLYQVATAALSPADVAWPRSEYTILTEIRSRFFVRRTAFFIMAVDARPPKN